MAIDHHVGTSPVAQVALGARSLAPLLFTGSTVNSSGGCRFIGGLDQEGAPAVSRGIDVVRHTVTGGLEKAPIGRRPLLPPLVSVTGVSAASSQQRGPHFYRCHGGIAIASQSEHTAADQRQIAVGIEAGIVPPLITLPDRQRGLVRAHVAGVIPAGLVGAIATHSRAAAILGSVVRLGIGPQDPRL